MNLTEEQRRAIERRDGSLFVHAGPGSGKTRVLVERFVRCALDDGVAVERLLAITFTEKAAAELKGRIRRRFLELGERERAREAEGAWVSTIHGFCSRVLRANALAAGVDPDYAVLSEAEARRLALEAFDRALEDFLRRARSEDRVDLVASYTPDKLERMVRAVYERLRSQGQREPRLPPLPEPPPGEGLAERERLERALATAGAALEGVDGKTVAEARAKIAGCADALARVPAGELGSADAFAKLKVTKRNAKALQGAALDELGEAFDAWFAACAGRKARADYRLLARLLEGYDRCYAKAKDARSALDFEDLELHARDLLKRERGLRAELAGRFEHVMVDEFQDTNPLQNEILDLIARDNLFTVGDELQSIYGFRHADVSVFRARRDAAAEAGRAERLATSFRAAPALLELLNRTFASVWEDYPPLSAGLSEEAATAEGPRAELLIVDRNPARWTDALGEDAFGESMHGVSAWRAAEARLLARRIDELIAGGECAAGDVAVLLRSGRDMDVYERALAERGIATYAVGGRGYWAHQQIGDVRAYLAALANPQDELSLYNVLASPMVGASLDALAIVRARARAAGKRDVWWALEEAFTAGGDGSEGLAAALPEADRERIGAFVERFSGERRAAPRISLETLIDRAVTASGYDRVVLAMPEGARRMANVRKLMRLAREYEADAGRDLRGFIDFVDEQDLLEAREGEAPLEGEGLDAVRLMTVHAAKGLEFPVVCVADLGRDAARDHGPLQISEDGRAGLEVASLEGGRHAALELDRIRAEQRARAEQEEKRIFFVAMTRAEHRLIVSGALDVEKWHAHEPLRPPIEWVWPALAPGAKLLFEGSADGVVDGVRCVLCSPATVDAVLPAADRAPAAPAAAPAEAVTVHARPRFAPVAAGEPLPVARISYSALESFKRCGYRFYLERVVGMRRPREAEVPLPVAGGDGDDAQLALSAPPEPAANGLAPLLRGTVVHELLEGVDFRHPAAPGPREVEDLIRAHGAVASASAVADVARLVEGFLASPLAARVAAARRVRAELPFAFELEPPGAGGQSLLVDGVVDVHAEEDDGLLIVDYKSDPLEGREPAEVVDERYGAQRLVYALAGLRSGAERVEAVYCFLEAPDRPVAAVFGPSDRPALEATLLELAEGIVSRRFDPTGAPHRELCAGCPGQPALCKWGPDMTLREPAEVSAPG